MDIKLDQHKVTFRNSFSKITIKISFSFHKHQSILIINHLSVKGEFNTPIVLRLSWETTKEPTALTTAPFTLS